MHILNVGTNSSPEIKSKYQEALLKNIPFFQNAILDFIFVTDVAYDKLKRFINDQEFLSTTDEKNIVIGFGLVLKVFPTLGELILAAREYSIRTQNYNSILALDIHRTDGTLYVVNLNKVREFEASLYEPEDE